MNIAAINNNMSLNSRQAIRQSVSSSSMEDVDNNIILHGSPPGMKENSRHHPYVFYGEAKNVGYLVKSYHCIMRKTANHRYYLSRGAIVRLKNLPNRYAIALVGKRQSRNYEALLLDLDSHVLISQRLNNIDDVVGKVSDNMWPIFDREIARWEERVMEIRRRKQSVKKHSKKRKAMAVTSNPSVVAADIASPATTCIPSRSSVPNSPVEVVEEDSNSFNSSEGHLEDIRALAMEQLKRELRMITPDDKSSDNPVWVSPKFLTSLTDLLEEKQCCIIVKDREIAKLKKKCVAQEHRAYELVEKSALQGLESLCRM